MGRIIFSVLIYSISTFILMGQKPQSDGLWAYYMFNGNTDNEIIDTSGTNYNANLCPDRFGRDNSCYRFNASDSSVISFGDSYDTLFAGNYKSFGVSVWIKPDTITQNMMVLGKYGYNIEHNREFFIRILDSVVDFGFYSSLTGGNAIVYRSETRIDDTSKWYNIAANYYDSASVDTFPKRVEMFINNNKENLKIYLAQTTHPSFIKDGTAPLCIGGVLATNDNPYLGFGFNGKIDDLIIYNKTLSTSDVNKLYTEDPLNSSILESSNTLKEFGSQQTIMCYPNPTKDVLTIKFPNEEPKTIEVIDITGKVIYLEKASSITHTIGIKELGQTNRMVFVRVHDKNHNIISQQKISIRQ